MAERYCKGLCKGRLEKTGHLSDLPKNGYTTQDEYTAYMKKNAVTGVEELSDKKRRRGKSPDKDRVREENKEAFTVEYKTKTQR